MKKEILIDIALRLKTGFEFLFLFGVLISLISLVIFWNPDNYSGIAAVSDQAFKVFQISMGVVVFTSISLLTPTPESLFKTRVDLLKLELTNEENRDKIINKGGETIDKIVEALENKYFKKDTKNE